MRKLSPCYLGLCSVVSLVLALAFLLVGIWSTLQEKRFSPVYTAISCSFGSISARGVSGSIFSGITFEVATGLVCSNPNEFSLTMEEPQAGNVYIGADREQVATLRTAPQVRLPAKESATIPIDGEIVLSIGLITSMLPILTASEVSIYLDPTLELDIDVNFLVGGYQTKKTMVLRCGFNMEGFDGNVADMLASLSSFSPNLGDVACADDWSLLEPDPVGVESVDASSFQLALEPEETEDLEQLKTRAFGVAQGCAYGLCGLFLLCSAGCAWMLAAVAWQGKPARADEVQRVPPAVIGSSSASP